MHNMNICYIVTPRSLNQSIYLCAILNTNEQSATANEGLFDNQKLWGRKTVFHFFLYVSTRREKDLFYGTSHPPPSAPLKT